MDVQISDELISMATTAPLNDPKTLTAADQPDKIDCERPLVADNILTTI